MTDQSEVDFTIRIMAAIQPIILCRLWMRLIPWKLTYEEEVYLATETMTPVTDITAVFQSRENGFDKECLEVNIEFLDPEDIEQFLSYLNFKEEETCFQRYLM